MQVDQNKLALIIKNISELICLQINFKYFDKIMDKKKELMTLSKNLLS